MSIVDLFDAVTTTRPYKPRQSPHFASQELAQEVARGWRRADLVDTFVQLVRDDRLPRFEP